MLRRRRLIAQRHNDVDESFFGDGCRRRSRHIGPRESNAGDLTAHHEANMSLEEIVDLLDRHGRRATYGAVAAVLGHSPRSLLRGRERGRRFSWIVNRETGMPTGYSEELIDPRLKESGPVIATDGELRTWLENPSSSQ